MRRFIKAALRHFSYRSRRRNPLLKDPEYAGLDALEAHLRSRHMPSSHITRAKQARVHQLLAGGAR